MQSLWLIFQLLLPLCLGYLALGRLPIWFKRFVFQILPYFAYLLLVAIAIEFTQVLDQISSPALILSNAIILACATSVGAFLCCYLLYKAIGYQPTQGKVSFDLLIKSLLNISYAFIALLTGYGIALFLAHFNLNMHISTWNLLLVFMFFIGLDLARAPLDHSWLNWTILLVPLGCVIGSILGACIAALLISNISLQDLIMLSQGYGFYSMSGIVVTELKNAELGSVALMNDLFREIFAILFMYMIGWRYPRSAISSAGATAMDVTLPMVKQACGNDFIPHAMVSGFILSILAPILLSLLAAL